MSEQADTKSPAIDDILRMTSDIVASFVSNNSVTPENLPEVIKAVFRTVHGIAASGDGAGEDKPRPAVPVNKSVTADYIICLEDGRKLKMLKRYLRSRYNLTPEEYRKRWGLAPDYPMVAPSYAEHRSEFAKKSGLGRSPRKRR